MRRLLTAWTRPWTRHRTRHRALAVGLALAVATSACSLQTLDAPKGGLRFEAEFTDVQGLVAGHSVQVSDVRIGTVTAIKLDRAFHAHVTMELEPGRRLPRGVTVSVARTSLLGENYIRINLPPAARMDTGPFLANDAVLTRTSVEPDLESITDRLQPVLAAFSGQDLSQAVDAVATAVQGKGPQLNKLIRRLSEVSEEYAAAGRDLRTTIDGLGRLGDSLAGKSRDLDRMPGRLIVATRRIQRDRTELKSAVQEMVRLGDAVNARVHARHGARLRALLVRLNRILAAMVRGRDQLKSFARTVDHGILRAPSVTYKGQVLAHTWLAGFAGGGGDTSRATATGGRGSGLHLFSAVRTALSPVTPKED